MSSHPRLTSLLRQTMNLTSGEAEAALRGVEAEAVSRCGGVQSVIQRAIGLRQVVASGEILKRYPMAKDVTLYARELGYTGKRRVFVHDGKVVSHGHADWAVFASQLSGRKRQS